jgi:predicted permease
MGVEFQSMHGRSSFARYALVAAAALLVLFAIVAMIRWNTHRARVTELSRAADAASGNARAYTVAVQDLENAGKRTGVRYVAAFTAMENISKNGFGYFAVAKERIDTLRADKQIDVAIAAARQRFPHPDTRFNARADEALAKEQEAKDQLTSMSAMMGTIMSNPIVALGLSSEDARSAGYRLGKASSEFAHSWNAVKDRARQLRDEAARRSRDARTKARAQNAKSVLAAIIDP